MTYPYLQMKWSNAIQKLCAHYLSIYYRDQVIKESKVLKWAPEP